MKNYDFTLRSGAKLHIDTAPFAQAVNLLEVVRKVASGMDKSLDVGDAALMSPEVRLAIYEVFPWATYDNLKLYPRIFDEVELGEKVRGDYFEICSKLIEVNVQPFFLRISSKSTDSKAELTKSQE